MSSKTKISVPQRKNGEAATERWGETRGRRERKGASQKRCLVLGSPFPSMGSEVLASPQFKVQNGKAPQGGSRQTGRQNLPPRTREPKMPSQPCRRKGRREIRHPPCAKRSRILSCPYTEGERVHTAFVIGLKEKEEGRGKRQKGTKKKRGG